MSAEAINLTPDQVKLQETLYSFALQGACANPQVGYSSPEEAAEYAYQAAQAMMKKIQAENNHTQHLQS